MPVEDIDFLKKNSIKENFVFLVDSKQRDRTTYPNPSEYVIEFQTPFKNVIGLNLIDSSIPRTMYNIDVYNNSIVFFIYAPDFIAENITPAYFQKVYLEPGDYSIQTLIIELNNKLKMFLNNDPTLPIIGITASPVTNPPDIQNRLQFTCPYGFIFDMRESSIAESLGFDGYVRKSEIEKPISERYYNTIDINTNNHQLYKSVNILFSNLDSTLKLNNTYTLFEGPKGVIQTIGLTKRKVAQRFYIPFTTNIVKIYVAFNSDSAKTVSFNIYNDVNNKPDGASLCQGNIAVSFSDGSYSDSTDIECPVNATTYYWVVFDSIDDVSIYYNDVLTPDTSLKEYDEESGTAWTSRDDIDKTIYYQLSIRIDVCDDYNVLKPFGIYSLVGERYIILRCKEIEENSFRSLAYTNNTLGIAKFTLGVVGYKEERLDYSNVPNREFHPIGKLTRLTLRFETSKGLLYDFKDVNHTLVFSIKYLEPVSTNSDFKRSIINSNYNGDFLKYQYGQEEQEEDSDDQDIDYNRDPFENYKNNEAMNLPWQVAQRNVSKFYSENPPEEESAVSDDDT